MSSAPEPTATDSTIAVRHWLERHKEGDDSARRELLEISMRRLRLLARKILADIPSVRQFEDTDDLLQNSALRLWKCLQNHQPESAIDYFRLAACLIRRELIDLSRHHFGHRAAKGHLETGLSSVSESAIQGGRQFPTNDDTSDPQKLSQWTEFHEYVEGLPEEDRSLFDLLWYQGLTMERSSELLGIPLRTLGRRWKMARVRLYRDLLSDADDSTFP
jgi:RNA polymerase sigma-70 factor (ECF subfamily)